MKAIFDSHAHYDDAQFDEDRDELLREMPTQGVGGVLNMSSDYASIQKTVDLVERYDYIYGAVGIHPENAAEYNEEVRKELLEILQRDKFVAVGEVGLDYYWESNPPREIQKAVLTDQYEIAKSLGIPIILHDREAHEDILTIAKAYPMVTSVFHAYSGSVEMAREIVKLGGYLGISGVLTFKNARKLPEVVQEIPLDRLLLETDAPYMAPVPFRGKRNRSDYLRSVAEKVAELKEITVEEVLETTFANVQRLFGLSEKKL
ncbi:TatD family hydrolase [Proteiniclasticum sp. BAD-10]|uniref:TatD family hydrolase n=1 Tax=Proteiniclasticum sediminis TaxID=2804028 RepID=A0A941CPD8_9CLOT|nr:TatD family hydrolase [Proteiniclasticum sediminis]MBR0576436.1 TatD family hydrolase [Proteiniclasticum sediminis]